MSRRYPGPPPDFPPGFVNPEYAHTYDGVAQSNLPPSMDPNIGWYMEPSLPNPEYTLGSPMHGMPGNHPLAGGAGEKRRNKLGYHRTSVACNHCRRRKIRCIPSQSDIHGRCTNCIRLKKECSFIPTDQQSSEGQSKQSSDGGLASNTSSPGPPGGERNSGYPSHVQSAHGPERLSPWPQQTAPPDDRIPNNSRGGMRTDRHFDFGDQTAQGYASTSMHLGAANMNEHWRKQHSSSTSNNPAPGSSFAPGAGSRRDVGWRGPLPSTPATFGDKASGSPQRAGNIHMPSSLNLMPSNSGFADVNNLSMGAPVHGVPLPYSQMHPQLPSQSWHHQGSGSEPHPGYSSWMYPHSGPGREMPGDGSSEN